MERFGVKASEVKKKKTTARKVLWKNKIDKTYLFNKWKAFDIDAKALREQSW